jgi:hypothetical protein
VPKRNEKAQQTREYFSVITADIQAIKHACFEKKDHHQEMIIPKLKYKHNTV